MRKNIFRHIVPFIALFSAMFFLVACSRRLPREVARADSLLATRPDSALALLRGVAGEVEGCSRADRMRYDLLRAEAQNKAYEDFTSDSTVRAVTEFYDCYGTPHERMRAYYVLAAAYRDLGRPLDEQRSLNKAIDLADTAAADCDHALLARIYGQLGKLYIHITSQRLAKEMLEKGIRHAQRANDRWASADYLHYIGLCYYNMHMPDSAVFYYEQSKKLYRQYADTLRAAYVSLSLAEAYTIKKNYFTAFRLIGEYEKESGEVRPDFSVRPEGAGGAYYAAKGQYYLGLGKADSALVYFYRERFCGDKSYLYSSYWDIAEAYKLTGDMDSVVKYKNFYLKHIDELLHDSLSIQLVDRQISYDAARKQADLRRDAGLVQRAKHFALAFILPALMVFIVLFVVIFCYRKRKEKLFCLCGKAEVQDLEDSATEWQRQSESIEMDFKDIDHLREQIQKALESDVVIRLREYALTDEKNKAPRPEDWAELSKSVGLYAAGAKQILISNFPAVNITERRLCYLLLCGFTPMEMSRLLNCSPQNVSSIRSRLGLKIFGRSMKAKDFDRYFIAATVKKDVVESQ